MNITPYEYKMELSGSSSRRCSSAKLDLNLIQPQMSDINSDSGTKIQSEDVAIAATTVEGSTMRSTNDSTKITVEASVPRVIPLTLRTQQDDGSTPGIAQFLSKPTKILQGDLTATDTPTTFTNIACTEALVTSPVYSQKLNGVMSLRFTTVVTLQVNANKFQQGRYILAFLPTGGASPNGTSPSDSVTTWINMHRQNKTQITQLPHVEIDINKTTEVQLRIPYQSAFSAYAFNNGTAGVPSFGDPGVFFMYPYSPLVAAAGSTTAGFTLWVHYEDVETFGNTIYGTNPTAEAQMSWNPRTRKNNKKTDVLSAEMDDSRSVSTGIKLVSQGFGQLSRVPLLSSLAGPISWATDYLSDAAYTMGWSKPRVNDKPIYVSRLPNPYLATYNQTDDSQPLSILSNNHVDPMPGFAGTDMDEMSIDYLKSIPSYLTSATWNLTLKQGDLLWNTELAPAFMSNKDGVSVQDTPISFFSTLFARYTGGFRFHIKVVKTEFHTGRLLVAFNPSESSLFTSSLPTYANTDFLSKTVLDLRDNSEFVVEVPWVSILPWRPNQINTSTTTVNPLGSSFGNLSIYVLDELVAPETVSSSVQVLIEVSGAEDMRFSVPTGITMVPLYSTEMQSNFIPSKIDPLTVDANMIGGTTLTVDTIDKDAACVGEIISSLRPLLKRGSIMGQVSDDSAVTGMSLVPYSWCTNTVGGDTLTNSTYDIYSVLSSMYSLQRGGVRVRAMSSAATGYTHVTLKYHPPGDTGLPNPFNTSTMTAAVYQLSSANRPYANQLQELGGVAVEVPYYHYNHSTPTCSQMLSPDLNYNYSNLTGSNSTTLEYFYETTVNLSQITHYRAGSDDCNFGGFVSIPMLAQLNPV